MLEWACNLNNDSILQKVSDFNILTKTMKQAEKYLHSRQGYPGKTLQKTIIKHAAGLYYQLTGKEPRKNFKYSLGKKPCSGEFYEFLQDFLTMLSPALTFPDRELRRLFSTDEADPKKIFDGESWGKCVRSYLQETKAQTEAIV